MTDTELCSLIQYAKNAGLRVILKPTVNCLNGAWRAFINFFDEDVPCEPKWSDWFRAHTEFQLHYAQIAEDTQCDMFITGCEMVMSQRREAEWRELIRRVKSVYHGPVSYNTDKYQKPFFFAEMGCMSTRGSGMIPNNWELKGDVDLEEQKEWYEKAFASMERREWIRGAALWSWPGRLYTEQEAEENRYYEFYLKPAEEIIRRYFRRQGK